MKLDVSANGRTTEHAIRVVHSYLAHDTLQTDPEHLGWLIISSYVLRNADLHPKNIALRYTHAGDVRLAPAYDIVTTQAYPDYALNPPGLSVAGRKSCSITFSCDSIFRHVVITRW